MLRRLRKKAEARARARARGREASKTGRSRRPAPRSEIRLKPLAHAAVEPASSRTKPPPSTTKLRTPVPKLFGRAPVGQEAAPRGKVQLAERAREGGGSVASGRGASGGRRRRRRNSAAGCGSRPESPDDPAARERAARASRSPSDQACVFITRLVRVRARGPRRGFASARGLYLAFSIERQLLLSLFLSEMMLYGARAVVFPLFGLIGWGHFGSVTGCVFLKM